MLAGRLAGAHLLGLREPTETVCVAGVGNGDGMGRERRGRAGSDELAPGISQ